MKRSCNNQELQRRLGKILVGAKHNPFTDTAMSAAEVIGVDAFGTIGNVIKGEGFRPKLTGDGLIGAMGFTQEDSDRLCKDAGDKMSEIGNVVGDAMGQVGSGIGDGMGMLGQTAGDALGNAGQTAGDVLGNAGQAIGNTLGNVGEGIGGLFNGHQRIWGFR